ncbi:hypothetical protein C8F04DRAFT_1230859 [Mycena alexandri]|uniref:Uncharacterized protein n=1 Tax=Mycena alexandri TaxID=1745969 RepID=A0AAD6T9V3_9AGAR|nr:hypothetical protein C8F04DRAFT_1230859 [Mycena alexandri]
MRFPLYVSLLTSAVLATASRTPRQIPALASWDSIVFRDLFIWNNNFNTSASPVNGTCHLVCDTVRQAFKNCTSPHKISQCLCTNVIGEALGSCVSCIAAETDSKLLNFTAKLGIQYWHSGCQKDGQNVSLPQVNTTSGLVLAANAERKKLSPESGVFTIVAAILGLGALGSVEYIL